MQYMRVLPSSRLTSSPASSNFLSWFCAWLREILEVLAISEA